MPLCGGCAADAPQAAPETPEPSDDEEESLVSASDVSSISERSDEGVAPPPAQQFLVGEVRRVAQQDLVAAPRLARRRSRPRRPAPLPQAAARAPWRGTQPPNPRELAVWLSAARAGRSKP